MALTEDSSQRCSLYIHVPFCAHKCEYCAFYSHPVAAGLVDRYVEALLKELELKVERTTPRTVFFGGGTPSTLTLAQWQRILVKMELLHLLGAEEWTVECNPATVSLEKAKLLRSFGVNRISMGVQTLDERLLERLGRIHTRSMVFRSYDTLRSAGFENINLDLMFAIPGQSMASWLSGVREVLGLQPEHLSTYEVIYEEDTPLYDQLNAGEFEVDEALACDMYDSFVDEVSSHGFQQYEVANFARALPNESSLVPSRACKHNVNYWRGGNYYGLGPSASGYETEVRTKNWSNTLLYCEKLEAGRLPIESQDPLSPLGRAGEIAAFGLRMNSGWPLREFRERTGFDLSEEWADEIAASVHQGWGVLTPDVFKLTKRGLRFADSVAELFLRV